MIRLTQETRREREGIVPMINVAFLLLIFFLMTAVIAPPDPLDVTPPEADADPGGDAAVLVVDANGWMALGDVRGDAVFAGLGEGPLRLRVDAALPGGELAALLTRLRAAGVKEVELLTLRR